MELASIIIFITAGAFVSGYSFRGYIGKEVKQIGADIRTEYAKAVAEAKKLEAEAKTKL